MALEALDSPKGSEERFLTDNACVLVAADHPIRKGVDRPFPAEDQLIEGIGVTMTGERDELFIGHDHPNLYPYLT